MSRIISLLFIVVLISVTAINAQDTGALDRDQSPFSSMSPRLSVKIWNKSGLDYFSDDIHIKDAKIDVPDESLHSSNGTNCTGFSSKQPSFRFTWERAAIGDKLPVRIFAVGSEDLTLVIQEPDGDWLCSDNYETSKSPLIDISSLRSGDYIVWIGINSSDESKKAAFDARLYVSIDPKLSPIIPPRPCCTSLSFSNPASTDEDPVMTYMGLHRISSDVGVSLNISVDMILRGKRGDSFRIELTPVDDQHNPITITGLDNQKECAKEASFCRVEMLRQAAEEHRDYSGVRKNAIEFSGSWPDLNKNSELLRFIFTVSPLNRSGDAGDAIISRSIECSLTDDIGNYDCADIGPA